VKYIFLIIIIHSLAKPIDLRQIESLKNWNKLQDYPVNIEWRMVEKFPISKAEKILNHDIKLIAHTIKDLDNYPNVFERVTKAHRVDSDVVHIVLDMPFPFDGRDYIVKYDTVEKNDYWMFSFSAIENTDIKIDPDHVRLPNAAGVWILYHLSKNKTRVIYAWNGELLGNFPDFGLEKAWITQGTEVLNWLDQALSNKLEQ